MFAILNNIISVVAVVLMATSSSIKSFIGGMLTTSKVSLGIATPLVIL